MTGPDDEEMTCAYEDCECDISAATAVERDDEYFCSAGCSEGRGCSHPGCDCGD